MIAPRRCRRSRFTAWSAFLVRSLIRCRTCKAKGYVRAFTDDGAGLKVVTVTSCRACDGTGFAPIRVLGGQP